MLKDPAPPIRPPRWALSAAFATIYLVWGSTYLGMRVMVETMPPLLAAGVRHGLAGLLLLGFTLVRGRRVPVTWAPWRGPAVLGFFFLVTGNGLVTWSLQWVASGVAALLVGTVPLFVALMQAASGRGPRTRPLLWASLLGGFAGVALLVVPSLMHPPGPSNAWGLLGVLLGSASWAWGSVLTPGVDLPNDRVLATGMQMASGGLALILLALASGEAGRAHWSQVSWRSGAALAYLVLFGSILAYLCFQWLLQEVGAAKVSTYAYVNPAVAVALGAWVLGETLSLNVVLAAVVICASVAVTIARPQEALRG